MTTPLPATPRAEAAFLNGDDHAASPDETGRYHRARFPLWASEQTSFPHETCEHALAHRISDKAEAAYRRGDQFEKWRKLMDAWGTQGYDRRLAISIDRRS